MREVTNSPRLREFMRKLAQKAENELRVYFTGGATAVLFGWRDTTIDIDMVLVPDSDSLLQSTPALKNELAHNRVDSWGERRRVPAPVPGRFVNNEPPEISEA